MKEPSVEALVEEAKLWTTDALVRDTLDILAQRIAELEAKLAEAEAALERELRYTHGANTKDRLRAALRSLRGET